jgi:hypothetical protein
MADQSTREYGKNLNRAWKIGAEHSLYSRDGTWYHQLTSFPGALIDANGYILFATEQDYRYCALLRIKQDVWVPAGIAQIPGYVRVQPADDVPRLQEELAEPPASGQLMPELPDIDLLNVTAREGRLRLVEHWRRERNRQIIRAKKQERLHTTGRLTCEVCGFDFEHVYGRIGAGFYEVHQKVPLAAVGTEITTTLEDLAILGSNCHRMVLRTNPFKSIEDLKRLVASST